MSQISAGESAGHPKSVIVPTPNRLLCFVLVLVDYLVQYTEVMPLCNMQFCGGTLENDLPKEILTDQRTMFVSRTLCKLCSLLSVGL